VNFNGLTFVCTLHNEWTPFLSEISENCFTKYSTWDISCPPKSFIKNVVRHKFNVFHVRALYYTTNIKHKQMHKELFVNYNTLLHVSTLPGHLHGELFVIVTLRTFVSNEGIFTRTAWCLGTGGGGNVFFNAACTCATFILCRRNVTFRSCFRSTVTTC
jgi:hypothetical protein